MRLDSLSRHLSWKLINFRVKAALCIHLRLDKGQFLVKPQNRSIVHSVDHLLSCFAISFLLGNNGWKRVNLGLVAESILHLQRDNTHLRGRLWRHEIMNFRPESQSNVQLLINLLPKIIDFILPQLVIRNQTVDNVVYPILFVLYYLFWPFVNCRMKGAWDLFFGYHFFLL